MLSILLSVAEPVELAPLPLQWAQFSRTGSLSYVREVISIATGKRRDDRVFPYQLRYIPYATGEAPKVRWADSATCPAVAKVIASLQLFETPALFPRGNDPLANMPGLDGNSYSLTAPSEHASKITLSASGGSPLADWIDGALDRLKSCWTATEA